MVIGNWYQVPGTRYLAHGTRYLVPGTGYVVPGTELVANMVDDYLRCNPVRVELSLVRYEALCESE